MNRTIVVADNDVVLLELLRSRCLLLGLRVETAMRGDDAVQMVRRLQPFAACIQHGLCCTDGRTVREVLTDDLHTRKLVVLDDQPEEGALTAGREGGSYVVPRGGNVWHRLEPLIFEFLEESEVERTDSETSNVAGDGLAATAKEELRTARRSRRSSIDWRIDEPERSTAQARSASTTPQRDARDSVLEMVFACFGYAKESAAASTAKAASPAHLPGPHRRGSAEPPWVLCIEDDSDFSLALKLRLEAHGIAVVRAFDGRTGYRTAFTHTASAILLDYNLPQGQGDYVLRRLKENPATAGVPVIVLTGIRSSATRRQMLALGADAYLTKPLDFDELIDALSEHVDVLPREYAAADY